MTSRDLGPQFQESILRTEHPTEHGGGVFPSSLDPRISLWLSPILLEEGVDNEASQIPHLSIV